MIFTSGSSLRLVSDDGLQSDLFELQAAFDRERVEYLTEWSEGGSTKGPQEVLVAISVAASSLAVAGPTLVNLIAQWLHRPGPRRIEVTKQVGKGKLETTVIKADGLTPAQFASVVQTLVSAVEEAGTKEVGRGDSAKE